MIPKSLQLLNAVAMQSDLFAGLNTLRARDKPVGAVTTGRSLTSRKAFTSLVVGRFTQIAL